MRDRVLMNISQVIDDSTGCYEVGELDFGILHTCYEYLEAKPGNRKKLAEWLKFLGYKCERSESPFKIL